MRRRMMLGRKSELPAGYRRCEYLESDGNQFIDFDIICNAKDIILTAVFLYMYDTVTQQPFYNQGTGEFLYKLA